jgi:hypothetical protein
MRMADSQPWQEQFARGFGLLDKRFAGHPIDRKNAGHALQMAARAGVTWLEIVRETYKVVGDSGMNPKDMKRLEKMWQSASKAVRR